VGDPFKSVVDLLARRLLIYEGNHRWVIGQMLLWDYVLVEPQLWDFTGEENVEGNLDLHVKGILQPMVPPGYEIPRWREAAPARRDQRPLTPEVTTLPFRGDAASEWSPE